MHSLAVDQVFSDYSESVIEFDKINSWDEEGENKAYYRRTKEIRESAEDWIGLFKVSILITLRKNIS